MTPKIKLGDRIDLLDVKNFSRCISSLSWWNRLILTLNAITNMRIPNGRVEMSENGILIDVKTQTQTQTTIESEATFQWLKIKSLSGDYVTCRSWDGETEGTVDILVAKPANSRTSFTSARIDSVNFTYTYDATDPNNIRLTSDGTTSYTQKCHPRYSIWYDTPDAPEKLPVGLIYAVKTNHTGVYVDDVELKMLEMTERRWVTPWYQ